MWVIGRGRGGFLPRGFLRLSRSSSESSERSVPEGFVVLYLVSASSVLSYEAISLSMANTR